jgi:hypothetical protein
LKDGRSTTVHRKTNLSGGTHLALQRNFAPVLRKEKMTKKRKADRIETLWVALFNFGQKNQINYDEWGALMLRMNMNLARNLVDAQNVRYEIVYKKGREVLPRGKK